MTSVFLALGANLGDRAGQMRWALRELDRQVGVRVLTRSSFRRTSPVGGPQQPDFVNGVARLATNLAPRRLLDLLLLTEARCGRVRQVVHGPRTLDLDLLTYGEWQQDHDALVLPHPRASQRAFVLEPLAQLAPGLCLDGRRVDTLLANLAPTVPTVPPP